MPIAFDKINEEQDSKIQKIWKSRNAKAGSPSDAPSISGIVREALDIGLDALLEVEQE